MPHCKSFVPRGIVDIERGIVDFEQGIVDFERGIIDVGRGMDDFERGMDEAERGIDDVGQARFVLQRTRNTGSTAGRERSCGACLPDAATLEEEAIGAAPGSAVPGSAGVPPAFFNFLTDSPTGEKEERRRKSCRRGRQRSQEVNSRLAAKAPLRWDRNKRGRADDPGSPASRR
jgi:hypothetical protein